MSTKTFEPIRLHGEDGHAIWLGSEESARAAVRQEWGDDVSGIESVGWMADVGWDRDTYELKREFLAESGLEGWWEGCSGPENGIEKKGLRRAWTLVWAADQ